MTGRAASSTHRADRSTGTKRDRIVHTTIGDPRAAPLLVGLFDEYRGRYGHLVGEEELTAEMNRYPDALFTPPHGAFLLLLRGEEAIGGGAFMPHEVPGTVELKRIWTSSGHRRQGLARRVVDALEQVAREQGHRRVYLTTGFRQPEAVGLYLSMGYRPLFDIEADWETVFTLSFEKDLSDPGTAA